MPLRSKGEVRGSQLLPWPWPSPARFAGILSFARERKSLDDLSLQFKPWERYF